MGTKTLDQRIERTPGVLGGRPRISGRRISVEQIVVWHEWLGRSADEIATEFDLALADIYAALAYYYDHQAGMDESIQDSQKFIDEVRQQIPSKLHSRSE